MTACLAVSCGRVCVCRGGVGGKGRGWMARGVAAFPRLVSVIIRPGWLLLLPLQPTLLPSLPPLCLSFRPDNAGGCLALVDVWGLGQDWGTKAFCWKKTPTCLVILVRG